MATINTHHEIAPARDGPARVVRLAGALLRPGVTRLLGERAAGGEVTEFLAQAASEHLDLSRFWGVVREDGTLGEVVLVSVGTGRTASMFLSGTGGESQEQWSQRERCERERSAVLSAACEHLSDPLERAACPVDLAQALIEPADEHLVGAFVGAGFARLADLAYLRREIPRRPVGRAPAWPAGVRVVSLDTLEPARGRADLLAAMHASYQGTLDCPALCGMRRNEDVLASHLSVGEHDPSLWFVLYADRAPAGCMLLSPVPLGGTIELVYLGLGAALRGRGLAAALLAYAIDRLAGRPERQLACAVDVGNTPAMRLYKGAKFRTFSTRLAMVRGLVPTTRLPG